MQLLPIDTLRAMSADEKAKLGCAAVKADRKADELKSSVRNDCPAVGKLVCVFEEDLNELKQAKKIASNTSLGTYWESITKAKLKSHWYSCAVTFGTFVRTDLITEADYDKNTSQCLETAASIATKCGGDVSHSAVIEAADELKDRSKDTLKNLKAILATVSEPEALSADKAKTLLARILAVPGFVHQIVVPAVGAEIAHMKDPSDAKATFLAINSAVNMFDVNVDATGTRRFPTEVIDTWLAPTPEHNVQVTRGGQPAETSAAEAPKPEEAPEAAAA
jgi:hypothetical protein